MIYRLLEFCMILYLICYVLYKYIYKDKTLSMHTKIGSTWGGIILLGYMIYSFISKEYIVINLYNFIKKLVFKS